MVLRRAAPRDVEAVVVAPDVEHLVLEDPGGRFQGFQQLAVGSPLLARLERAAVAGFGVREVARDEQRDRFRGRTGRRGRRGRRQRKRPPSRRDDGGGPGCGVGRSRALGREQGRGGSRPGAQMEVGELEEDGREARGRSC